jgi:hypothetical protein
VGWVAGLTYHSSVQPEATLRSRRVRLRGITGLAIRSGGAYRGLLLTVLSKVDIDPFGSLFQCHQCQDLLENNLARKRPIEGQ